MAVGRGDKRKKLREEIEGEKQRRDRGVRQKGVTQEERLRRTDRKDSSEKQRRD
jgi:hypothetical protein